MKSDKQKKRDKRHKENVAKRSLGEKMPPRPRVKYVCPSCTQVINRKDTEPKPKVCPLCGKDMNLTVEVEIKKPSIFKKGRK